ncbi:MAG: exodeoxyribonuclease VII small subunit [Clostridia bacterium]|jgi:exodeoxyribonuclease VII small subunit|nr:exodeoxyribonuclease VII small subunit [Clostridia bacterium]
MSEDKRSFEEKLQDVQEIIARIEAGTIPLEESVRQYEEGMKQLNALDEELNGMSRRLTVLMNGKDGQPEELAVEEGNETL